MARPLAAVTGATGFLGRHLVRALADAGWRVRALVRKDPVHALWRGVDLEVVPGGLSDPAALRALCQGADAVIHGAGLIKAADRAAFDAVNVEGARQVALAARAVARQARVVAVSSLAARAPRLSDYAASKRAGEDAVLDALDGAAVVARPSAVYGPGDQETLRLFQAADALPVLPLFDPRARVGVVHVADAARAIVGLAASEPALRGAFAVTDGRGDGYGWRELMETAARTCGRRPRLVRVPAGVLLPVAAMSAVVARLTGDPTVLTPGKLRELTHLDWSVAAGERPPSGPPSLYDLEEGFRHTVCWYRDAGWLRRRQ